MGGNQSALSKSGADLGQKKPNVLDKSPYEMELVLEDEDQNQSSKNGNQNEDDDPYGQKGLKSKRPDDKNKSNQGR